jgi:hypothetical protein
MVFIAWRLTYMYLFYRLCNVELCSPFLQTHSWFSRQWKSNTVPPHPSNSFFLRWSGMQDLKSGLVVSLPLLLKPSFEIWDPSYTPPVGLLDGNVVHFHCFQNSQNCHPPLCTIPYYAETVYKARDLILSWIVSLTGTTVLETASQTFHIARFSNPGLSSSSWMTVLSRGVWFIAVFDCDHEYWIFSPYRPDVKQAPKPQSMSCSPAPFSKKHGHSTGPMEPP